ncbi:MAG: hypothetical protein JSS82_09860 [Bacteroidetes bacterium]|nr:hypothetical protein [Bacteroidota bacterium]
MSSNTKQRLSRLMRMSWEIQKGKNRTRAKALAAAWAIMGNEDITVFYLVRKLNRHKPVPERVMGQMGLFRA